MTAAGSGYLPPQAAVYNTVDKELRRQLFNALNDSKCIEITLAAVPSDSVTIIGAQFMAVGATEYVCHITVKTRTVDNL
jgi:hypothetical protein